MRQVFSDQAILDAAIKIVKDEGYESITMRRVAEEAGCSVQPLYSAFGDRETFMRALYERAVEWVRAYNSDHEDAGCNAFSSVGVAHIRIAQQYPSIFSFVYMSPYVEANNLGELLSLAEQPGVIQKMQAMWGIDGACARSIYANLAIYTHGLATLIMAGAKLSDDELQDGMNSVFRALAASAGICLERGTDEE